MNSLDVRYGSRDETTTADDEEVAGTGRSRGLPLHWELLF